MFPAWLHVLSIVALAAGFACAAWIVRDAPAIRRKWR